MTNTFRNPLRTLALAGLACALALGVSACRKERSDEPPHQFLPDMDDSPKFKSQTESEFFADGRAMRPRVKGVVPFGDSARLDDRSRARYLRASPELFDGINPTGKPLAENEPAYVSIMPAAALDEFKAHSLDHGKPYASDSDAMRAMILRGQERFNIYCAVCHGFSGEGGDPKNDIGGVVGRRWRSPVPAFHDPKYSDPKVKTGQDGYIFGVIRNGVPDASPALPPKMPSYADKVNEIDSWAIVAYIRTLQAAWNDPTPPSAAPTTPAAPAARPGGNQ